MRDGFSLIIAAVALLCSSCSRAPSPPIRPANVPNDTFWVGGPEGGTFIRLQKHSDTPERVYDAWIYNDRSGGLWYSGRLVLSGPREPEPDLTQPDTFQGWDGERLHLSDGRTMEKAVRSPTTSK